MTLDPWGHSMMPGRQEVQINTGGVLLNECPKRGLVKNEDE